MATKRKVLLMGKSAAGKTSIRIVIFTNATANDTKNICPTIEVEHSHVRFFGNVILNLWDCGGQGAFMQSYVANQKYNIFKHVDAFIYVFDADSKEFYEDLRNYEECLASLMNHSSGAKVFCLIHKMDLIPLREQLHLFEQRKASITKSSGSVACDSFATTIWDESLFKAWSDIMHHLVPNILDIKSNIVKFADIMEADEIILFEKSSFLILCRCERKEFDDPRRFEKISKILKQFKRNCNKFNTDFTSIEVRNSKFAAYFENFTSNTFIMVVTSDPEITSIATVMNIRSGKKCFEKFEEVARSMSTETVAVKR